MTDRRRNSLQSRPGNPRDLSQLNKRFDLHSPGAIVRFENARGGLRYMAGRDADHGASFEDASKVHIRCAELVGGNIHGTMNGSAATREQRPND